jgi:secreted trypsin-like serine protease
MTSTRYSLFFLLLLLLLLSLSSFVRVNAFTNADSDSGAVYYGELDPPGGRIVNGQDALPNRYPYYVALLDKNDNFRCGGTLIAPNIVLSAAHCQ